MVRFLPFVILAVSLPVAAAPRAPVPGDLPATVTRACRSQGCPPEVLWAIAVARTRLHDGAMPGDGSFGPFGLVPGGTPSAEEAAALAGEDAGRLRSDLEAQARAAAALLTHRAFREAPARDPMLPWVRAAAGFAGSGDAAVAGPFLARVVTVLSRGGAPAPGADAPFAPIGVAMEAVLAPYGSRAASPDYAGAAYAPACYVSGASGEHNYTVTARPGDGNAIDRVVIHVMEGSYTSAINWFQNCDAGASAHYNVSEAGEITQSVLEKDIAWHAGNWDYNVHSIGIEHEGHVSDAGFPDAMYQASAALVAHLCQKYGFPCDRDHVVGHDEVPGCPYGTGGGGAGCHTDPGSNWDWDTFMAYVTGGVVPPATGRLLGVIRDSDIYQGANLSGATVSLSNGWVTQTGASGLYQFPDTPAGTYQVTASAPGYKSKTVSKTVEAGIDNWKSIALEPCTPSCPAGSCGADGCGGTCSCPAGASCVQGQCVLPPDPGPEPAPEPVPEPPPEAVPDETPEGVPDVPAADAPDVSPDLAGPDDGPGDPGSPDAAMADLGPADPGRTDPGPADVVPPPDAGTGRDALDAKVIVKPDPGTDPSGGGCTAGGAAPLPGFLSMFLLLGAAWVRGRRARGG